MVREMVMLLAISNSLRIEDIHPYNIITIMKNIYNVNDIPDNDGIINAILRNIINMTIKVNTSTSSNHDFNGLLFSKSVLNCLNEAIVLFINCSNESFSLLINYVSRIFLHIFH